MTGKLVNYKLVNENSSTEELSTENELKHKTEEVEKFPNLVAFIDRIEKLPRISDFLNSDRSPKPMNNKMAKFGQA